MEIKKSQKADLENKRGIFLQIGLVLTLGVILLAFEWTTRPAEISDLMAVDATEAEEDIIPITRQQEVLPPPPPPPPQVIEEITIVEDDVEIDDELLLDDVEADQDMEIEIVEFEEEEEAAEEEVFIIVEDMPSFKGKQGQAGLLEFRNWVQRNMSYPTIAQENGISGRVTLQFAISSTGEVVDVHVLRGVDPSLDEEARRAVLKSPKWTPGKQRGKSVKVQFTMPVVFVLN